MLVASCHRVNRKYMATSCDMFVNWLEDFMSDQHEGEKRWGLDGSRTGIFPAGRICVLTLNYDKCHSLRVRLEVSAGRGPKKVHFERRWGRGVNWQLVNIRASIFVIK